MNKTIALLFYFFVVLFTNAYGQQDSLLNRINQLQGLEKIGVLLNISENTRGYAPELSLEFAEQSFNLAIELEDLDSEIAALKSMGLTNFSTGNYETSLDNFTRILTLQEEREDARGIAGALYNLGLIYDQSKRYDIALEYYQRSLDLNRNIRDSTGISNALNTIGFLHNKNGSNDLAYDYFTEAYQIEELQKDTLGLFATLSNIGSYYFTDGQLDSSLLYFQQSLAIGENLNNNYDKAHLYNNIAKIHSKKNSYSEAINFFNQSLELSEPMEAKSRMIESYKGLADANTRLSRYKTAMEYYKLHSDIKDLAYNESNTKRIAEIETNYQIQRREKEIELLKKESQIQQLNLSNSRLTIYSLIGGLGLIFVLGAFFYQKYRYRVKSNALLELQNQEIAKKNIDILDSIVYAKGIQDAIRPDLSLINQVFQDSFIFTKARDIVNGDFYWFAQKDGLIIVAVLDCTGHGVPGAFMTVMANSMLNQIVLEQGITSPAHVLSELNKSMLVTLHQENYNQITNEGMDIGICLIDPQSYELVFAGAKRPLYYFQNRKLNIVKGNKLSIAGTLYQKERSFDEFRLSLNKNDTFYMFSDGMTDQFGGVDDKKFLTWRLKHLLIMIQPYRMVNQLHHVEKEISTWMNGTEQTDDMLLLGIKV
ncbi:MAG: tetratricopeptide repeat protein [Cyclobacteriaceae bacterium]